MPTKKAVYEPEPEPTPAARKPKKGDNVWFMGVERLPGKIAEVVSDTQVSVTPKGSKDVIGPLDFADPLVPGGWKYAD